MVSAAHIAIGTAAAGGLAGGVAIDRSLADTAWRVERRKPEIAQPDGYGELEHLPGRPQNVLAQGVPLAVALVGAGGAYAAATMLPLDRVWTRHPLGLLAISVPVAGAAAALGVFGSRTALG